MRQQAQETSTTWFSGNVIRVMQWILESSLKQCFLQNTVHLDVVIQYSGWMIQKTKDICCPTASWYECLCSIGFNNILIVSGLACIFTNCCYIKMRHEALPLDFSKWEWCKKNNNPGIVIRLIWTSLLGVLNYLKGYIAVY